MKSRIKKMAFYSLMFCIVIVTAIAGLFLIVVQPGGSGTLASLRLPDGSEYRVTQRCNWSFEPYTVSFYMRSPDGRWGWCYIDHESMRWWHAGMTYEADTDTIVVTNGRIRRATLDRSRNVFQLNNGSINHELDAPQSWVDQPGFASL